ncbi:phage tail protein, partial [Streptomyces sp. NPDC055078]
ARSAVSSLISSVVSLFSTLPGRIVSSLGNIGARIVSKIKSGLPSSVRNLLPFANGGIVTQPTAALIGEAGKEVVLPLTRPARTVELAQKSGLLDLLARRGAVDRGGRSATVAGDRHVTHNWNISTPAQDSRVLAEYLYGQMARAAGV